MELTHNKTILPISIQRINVELVMTVYQHCRIGFRIIKFDFAFYFYSLIFFSFSMLLFVTIFVFHVF